MTMIRAVCMIGDLPMQGPQAVDAYIKECKELGFDMVELSVGFISLPVDDWARLVEKVQKVCLAPFCQILARFCQVSPSFCQKLPGFC